MPLFEIFVEILYFENVYYVSIIIFTVDYSISSNTWAEVVNLFVHIGV